MSKTRAAVNEGSCGWHVLRELVRRGRPLSVLGLLDGPDIRGVFKLENVGRTVWNLHNAGLLRQIHYQDPTSPNTRFAYELVDNEANKSLLDRIKASVTAVTPRNKPTIAGTDLAGVMERMGVKLGSVDDKVDTKPTNPKDRAATHRLDLSLFPDTAVIYGALAMTEGDVKYGGYNYREAGVNASVYYAACKRHLAKWYNGEDDDPKTRVPHLANALACIAVLIDGQACGKLNDDRPPHSPVAAMLAEMELLVKHLHEMYPDGPGRYTAAKETPNATV